MSGGKAKVLSKKPSRTFISIKPRMDKDKAIHHYLDEHATLPTASPPCHPGPAAVCPPVDLSHMRSGGVEHVCALLILMH